jgi:hypothetical protein
MELDGESDVKEPQRRVDALVAERVVLGGLDGARRKPTHACGAYRSRYSGTPGALEPRRIRLTAARARPLASRRSQLVSPLLGFV